MFLDFSKAALAVMQIRMKDIVKSYLISDR